MYRILSVRGYHGLTLHPDIASVVRTHNSLKMCGDGLLRPINPNDRPTYWVAPIWEGEQPSEEEET